MSRLEIGHPEGLAIELEPVPQHVEHAFEVDKLSQLVTNGDELEQIAEGLPGAYPADSMR